MNDYVEKNTLSDALIPAMVKHVGRVLFVHKSAKKRKKEKEKAFSYDCWLQKQEDYRTL